VEPVETAEGQVYCRDCITTWLVRERGKRCPLSSTPLTLEELRGSRVLEAVIDDLRIRCNRCSSVMQHGAIKSHLSTSCCGTTAKVPAAATEGTLADVNGRSSGPLSPKRSSAVAAGADGTPSASGWNTPPRITTTPLMPRVRLGKENADGWSTPSAGGTTTHSAKKEKKGEEEDRTLKSGLVYERFNGMFHNLPDFDSISPVDYIALSASLRVFT
jgi:hypothetical protein